MKSEGPGVTAGFQLPLLPLLQRAYVDRPIRKELLASLHHLLSRKSKLRCHSQWKLEARAGKVAEYDEQPEVGGKTPRSFAFAFA
jgi:hypothetical protein